MIIEDLFVKAKFFSGLSDSTRLSILLALVDREMTVSEIVEKTGHSQSNISNHLKCLVECGLVNSRREWKNVCYFIRDTKTKKLLSLSEEIIKKVHSDIEACLRHKK